MRKRDRKRCGSAADDAFCERIPEVQFCEASATAAAAATENNPADETPADAKRESQEKVA